MSARPGLYGGQPAMAVPTVINNYDQIVASRFHYPCETVPPNE
jgi:hypothetical protein